MYGFARLLSAWLVPFRFQKRNNPFRCKGTAIFRHIQKNVYFFFTLAINDTTLASRHEV